MKYMSDMELYHAKEIEILMMDYCTKNEAIKQLERGCGIFEGEDFEKFFDEYMEEWDTSEEDIAEFRRMIETKEPAPDWGIVVTDSGKTYYIMYVL